VFKEELFEAEAFVDVVKEFFLPVADINDKFHSALEHTVKHLLIMIFAISFEDFSLCELIIFDKIKKCDLKRNPVIPELCFPLFKEGDVMSDVEVGDSEELML
jgi:hypothetical protein